MFPLQDELARVFVSLFDAKRLLYQLLWNMFSKEVMAGMDIAQCTVEPNSNEHLLDDILPIH